MERAVDLIAAVTVLVAGIVLVVLEEREIGGIVVSSALGFIAGLYRERPGGLDQAIRRGDVEVDFIDHEGGQEDA